MNIVKRIYDDFLKPSRLPQYERILDAALNEGYEMVSIESFYKLVSEEDWQEKHKMILVNRHDIDTSPKVARDMFNIEWKIYGDKGTSSFYFRDCTKDCKLIKEINQKGYEASYHYEELATCEKAIKSKSAEGMRKQIKDAQNMFLKDLFDFRKQTGAACLSVASHGDFVNNCLGVQNKEILQDDDIRRSAGIVVEAYDPVIEGNINERVADHTERDNFTGKVIGLLTEHVSPILILTHPRNWKVDIGANISANYVRIREGMHYH